jgi:glutaredoxin
VTKLTLYTKPDCSLCDEALAAIERVHRSVRFEIEQVDITRDHTLRARYGERIPVVEIDGIARFELRVDERRLEELLEHHQGPRREPQAAEAGR